MKIVFLDAITVGNVQNLHLFDELGDYTQYQRTKPDQTIERCENAEIIITNKVVFNREILDQLPQIKMIAVTATGLNNVDLEYAAEKGIVVKNVADYSTESVAQSTFAMILSMVNRVQYYDQYVKSGEYAKQPVFTHIADGFWELKGKRFGIIGMGNIGRRVAAIAQVFGCEVVYFSTSGKNNQQPYKQLKLSELIESSNIVSIHAPLNKNTKDLIAANELREMKKDAILVNAGRGGIVNEKALSEAIDHDEIAGACLDVFSVEPMEADNPLNNILKKEKVIFAPHTAWASIEARTLLVEKTCKNIRDFIGQ
jgi:lactate dehydrogenase-like 2-hydroxyacid dehydrogenase